MKTDDTKERDGEVAEGLVAQRGSTDTKPFSAADAGPQQSMADLRALVRDVVAEELTRFWERRFGGRP